MKKLLATLLFLSLPAFAQESGSVSLSAAEQAAAERGRITYNVHICEKNNLAANCTNAQLTAAGSSDQVAPNTTAGRLAIVKQFGLNGMPSASDQQYILARQKVRWASATQQQRDDYCINVLGLGGGCDPFAR
jgi:hypothetical protein